MLVSEDGGGAGLPETLRPFADPQQRRERLVKQWTHCAANLSDPNHQLQMIPQQHVLTALKILSSSPIWFYDLRHILYLCDEDFRAACCFANLDERGYEVVDGGLPFVAALCKMRQVNSDEVRRQFHEEIGLQLRDVFGAALVEHLLTTCGHRQNVMQVLDDLDNTPHGWRLLMASFWFFERSRIMGPGTAAGVSSTQLPSGATAVHTDFSGAGFQSGTGVRY
mmetsp:Transcript_44246/g.96254  ORF Transcript_44246/g.96254 Transcript_44246/m.96254 type:complete len:223 (-) Transcript_44246:144-812(-)